MPLFNLKGGVIMQKQFNIILRLCLLLFICTILTITCMKKDEREKGIKVIKYFTRATPDELIVWEKVINNFMQENPDIKVIVENVVYRAYWEKLLTMIAGGTSPDVVFMESTRLPGYVSKNALIAIDDLIKSDADIKLNDFYPVALKSYQMNNHLYGLPNDIAVSVIFYNKDLFDEQGVNYPQDGWTWNDLVRIGKQLTVDKNKDGKIDIYGISTYAWKCAIWQNNGDLVDDPVNPKKSTINSTAAKQALQFCSDLVFKHKIAPPSTWWQSRQGHEMFMTRQVAMSVEGHWMVPYFRKAKFNWDVVTLPKGKKRAGECYGSCFSIPAGCKNVKEAWRLIKYMAGEKGQKTIVSLGFSTPALKSIANSKYFYTSRPENARAFLKMIPYGHLRAQTPYILEIEDTYWKELDKFWLGKTSVNQATKNISKKVNKILKQ